MQSLKQILAEMGFNKDAPLETQKAFVKHLIAAANQTRPTSVVPHAHQNTPTNPSPVSAETNFERNFVTSKRASSKQFVLERSWARHTLSREHLGARVNLIIG